MKHVDDICINAVTLNDKMSSYPLNVVLGKRDGKSVSLRRPSFDCGWYWGFGYLGNYDCHYHLDGIAEGKNINTYDAIKKHFGDSLTIKDDKLLWQFAEVVDTIYQLRNTANMFFQGGSYLTKNPRSAELRGKGEWYQEIIEVLIPNQIEELYKILAQSAEQNKLV